MSNCINSNGEQGVLSSQKNGDRVEIICTFEGNVASTVLNATDPIVKDVFLSINASSALNSTSSGDIILNKPDGVETYNRSPKSFVLDDTTLLNLWDTKNENGNGEVIAQVTKLHDEKMYELLKIKLIDFIPFENDGIIFDAVKTSNNTLVIAYTEGGTSRNRDLKIKEFDIDNLLNNNLVEIFKTDVYSSIDNGQLFSLFSTDENVIGVAFSTGYGSGPENVLVTAFNQNREIIASSEKINTESNPSYGAQFVSCSTLATDKIACCFQSNWAYGTSWAKVCTIFTVENNVFEITKPEFQVTNSVVPGWNWGGFVAKLSDGFIATFHSGNYERAFGTIFDNNGVQKFDAFRLDSEEVNSYAGKPIETYLSNVVASYAKCYSNFCNNYLALIDKNSASVTFNIPTVESTHFLAGFVPYLENFGKCILVDYGLQMISSNNFEGISQKMFLVKEDSLKEINIQDAFYACFDSIYLGSNGEVGSVSIRNVTTDGCYLDILSSNLNQESVYINKTLVGDAFYNQACDLY